MPNNYDFSKIKNVKEIRVNPRGWVNPVVVEYGSEYHGEVLSYFWRVKGTTHTFIIPILRMDYLTGGDYTKHFEEVLENFRDDYLGWLEEGLYTPWMKEYYNMYNSYIQQ